MSASEGGGTTWRGACARPGSERKPSGTGLPAPRLGRHRGASWAVQRDAFWDGRSGKHCTCCCSAFPRENLNLHFKGHSTGETGLPGSYWKGL